MRRPATSTKAGANDFSDNLQDLRTVLNSQREPMVELMLRIIEDPGYNKYLDFASTAPRRTTPVRNDQGRIVDWKLPEGSPEGSLEDLHNTYHSVCGGQGHMARVPVAAFDPIFWFHHW